jgi:chondroitin-sulfate-ABC endolyase/exolyase
MKNHFVLIFSIFLLAGFYTHAGTIYSFEDGLVPSVFKVKRGTLSVGTEKAKLGTRALQWNWVANDTLVAAPVSMNTASIQPNGGITTWIYNENPSTQKLILWFYEYETSTTRRCSLEVSLNFKGWRCVWARFRADMGHPGYTLRSMKWESPKTGSGMILIDYLEFVNEVSWERISDMQYTVNNTSAELEDFVAIRNVTPVTPPASITEAQRTAVQTIRQRMDDWHLGTGRYDANSIFISRKNAINSYVQTALNKTGDITLTTLPDGTVKGDGLFPMNFYGVTVDGIATKTFRDINEKFLIQLAYDAIKNNKASSRELILKIFDWYYDQGWADGSALGCLRFEMLRSAGFFHSAYLMRDAMPAEQFLRVMNAYNWYSMFGKVYQTPTEKGASADQIRALLMPKLFYAASMKNELQQAAALQSVVRYANNALSPAPGFLDCIKPDYSGYHHRGPYFNAYYPDALYVGSLTYYFLSGTPYALSEETFIHLKKALLTFGFLCAGYDTPGAITGRFPAQTEILDQILPAFAYLALSRETPDQELTAFFKRMWKPTEEPLKSFIAKARTDIAFKSTPGEVEKMLELAETTIPAGASPVGTKFMPYSGLLISRQPDYVLTAKGYSKYIWDFESSSTENLYGRYLSYGHVELSKLSGNIKSYRPSNTDWDWSHIPGTTAKYLTKTELNSQNNPALHRNFSDEPFLGGVGFNKTVSVFANLLHDNTFDTGFYARKSVFQFDSIYTFLGSGIKNSDRNYFVHTTLFQNQRIYSTDIIKVNGSDANTTATALINPLLKDNYGNAYIVKDGTVNVDFTTSFISGYINHGRVLTSGKYAYQMVTGVSDNDLNTIASAETAPVEIVRNDEAAQIVYHPASKTTAAVIFDAANVINSGKIYRINIPSIVVMQERHDTLEIAFTDPDMHRPSATNISTLSSSTISADGELSTLQIELNGIYEKIAVENEAVVTLNGTGTTTIEYSKMKDGQTYRVYLRMPSTATQKPLTTERSAFRIFNSGLNCYRIETNDSIFFHYRIYNVAGTLMNNQQSLIASIDLNIGSYPEGIYFLQLNSDKEEKFVKLLR